MVDLMAGDTRVFLFHSADASADPGGAMEKVNAWLSKDRAGSPYANLRVQDISITTDGKGGVYTTIVCSLGRASAAPSPSTGTGTGTDAASGGSMGNAASTAGVGSTVGANQDPSAAI
ncbi:MAG: hypothetical protein ICV72_12255 [Aldersonia sp.]|nr:hypothetical protein [Aldersonia sp.]